MYRIYVLGLGGVGGYVVDKLPMAIASLSLDLLEKGGIDISKYLVEAGSVELPRLVDSITLCDGDVFNPRNALRQGMGTGGKLVQRMLGVRRLVDALTKASDHCDQALEVLEKLRDIEVPEIRGLKQDVNMLLGSPNLTNEEINEIRRAMVCVSFLRRTRIIGYNEYVTPENIGKIMPIDSVAGAAVSADYVTNCGLGERQCTIVFMAVDNFKSRYEIAKYVEGFDNVLLLNGGNSKTYGHVTVYERSKGKNLDPALYEVYENIRPDIDKRPDELGCVQVAPQHDQLAVTNAFIADVMLSRFLKWARKGLTEEVTSDDGKTMKVRYNEVLIDIDRPSVVPIYHPLTKKKKEIKK